MERAKSWEDLRLTDAGKLLVTFGAAKAKSVPIEAERLDPCVFLLNLEGLLRFSYSFRFDPLPYSHALREDAFNLVQASYLSMSSPLWITAAGEGWLSSRASMLENGEAILEELGAAIARYSGLDGRGLFNAVYDRLASTKV